MLAGIVAQFKPAILEACGFDRPDISLLSEEFLLEIQHMQHKNLAVEALKKLLNGEIKSRTRGNVVQNQKFSERLTNAIARYHNRSVDALQVVQELIGMAKELSAEPEEIFLKCELSASSFEKRPMYLLDRNEMGD